MIWNKADQWNCFDFFKRIIYTFYSFKRHIHINQIQYNESSSTFQLPPLLEQCIYSFNTKQVFLKINVYLYSQSVIIFSLLCLGGYKYIKAFLCIGATASYSWSSLWSTNINSQNKRGCSSLHLNRKENFCLDMCPKLELNLQCGKLRNCEIVFTLREEPHAPHVLLTHLNACVAQADLPPFMR